MESSSGVIQTRGRGLFRKSGTVLKVGDEVDFEILEDGDGVITKIHPRKNSFDRPPVANVELFIIAAAFTKPRPNFTIIDKFLIMAESKGIPLLIVFNKSDLESEEQKLEILSRYQNVYPVLSLSAKTGEGISELKEAVRGKKVAFAGPSGVGKSSLTNILCPGAKMETGRISNKTSRGRHTTRHVEIFAMPSGGKLFDTPGFSSLDLHDVKPQDLDFFFPEFRSYMEFCRFDDCSHIHEPDCAVIRAVSEGKINRKRYESYRFIYQELLEKERRK